MTEYTDFVQERKAANPQESFKDIGAAWQEHKKKAETGDLKTEPAEKVELPPEEPPGIDVLVEGEEFEVEVEAQEPIKVVKEDVVFTDDDNTGTGTGTIESNSISEPCDDSELSKYSLVMGSIHRSIKGIISTVTDGNVNISDEDMRDLNAAGAEVVKKYDAHGWIKEHFPTVAYVFTLLTVVLKTTFQYTKWKKQQQEELEATEKPKVHDGRTVPPIDTPKSHSVQ